MEKINIQQFLELAATHPVLDVRSPGEYKHAHIPGAISFPLFTDEERKIVGTAYKQESRATAIKAGLEFFSPKMLGMVEEAEKIAASHNTKTLLIYCWRGGMRSGGVGWLMNLYGFNVYLLMGGYKKFRNYVLDLFNEKHSINILGGYTGSGKTELLKALGKAGEPVIDLEELAAHKGSAFGNIGMPAQPGQEMFENLLAMELRKKIGALTIPQPVWMEDESQRIGHVNIPPALWNTMRESPVYFLDIPFEERLSHITEEYGTLDQGRMMEAVERISSRLGGLNTKNVIAFINEGNMREAFRVLLHYYDKYYLKGLHNRENPGTLINSIPLEKVDPSNVQKLIPIPIS